MNKIINLFKLFVIFIFFIGYLSAEVLEEWNKKDVFVGEEVTLKVEYQKTDISEWNLPQEDIFLYKNEEDKENKLPYIQIKRINKDKNTILITVIFFDSGDHHIPISYKTMDGEDRTLDKKITVKSVIDPQKDSKILDIAPPLEFRGPFLGRLLLIILIGIAVIGSVVYLLYYFSKQKPVDAIIQQPLEIINDTYYLEKINELLKKDPINHKEFIYTLSGYIKESISNKYKEPVNHLTFDELISFLYTKYTRMAEELKNNSDYFNSIKYMPDSSLLTKEEAIQKFKKWRHLL